MPNIMMGPFIGYSVTITAKIIIKLPKSKQLKLNFLKWIGAFFFSEATRLMSILRLANSSSLSPLRWREPTGQQVSV